MSLHKLRGSNSKGQLMILTLKNHLKVLLNPMMIQYQKNMSQVPIFHLENDPTDSEGASNAFDEAYNSGGASSSRRTLSSARKWIKDHTPDLIIRNPDDGVKTRSATHNECLYHNLLSKEEPKKVEDALKDADWVMAMQEELNDFERNEVWKLVPRP